jgi:hypothetical protein
VLELRGNTKKYALGSLRAVLEEVGFGQSGRLEAVSSIGNGTS